MTEKPMTDNDTDRCQHVVPADRCETFRRYHGDNISHPFTEAARGGTALGAIVAEMKDWAAKWNGMYGENTIDGDVMRFAKRLEALTPEPAAGGEDDWCCEFHRKGGIGVRHQPAPPAGSSDSALRKTTNMLLELVANNHVEPWIAASIEKSLAALTQPASWCDVCAGEPCNHLAMHEQRDASPELPNPTLLSLVQNIDGSWWGLICRRCGMVQEPDGEWKKETAVHKFPDQPTPGSEPVCGVASTKCRLIKHPETNGFLKTCGAHVAGEFSEDTFLQFQPDVLKCRQHDEPNDECQDGCRLVVHINRRIAEFQPEATSEGEQG